MRVSGRNRRQSYRGEEPTMAFWLPLNASVFFVFFQTRFSIRDLPSNLTALYVTLCRLHFLLARIVRHSSIPVTVLSTFFFVNYELWSFDFSPPLPRFLSDFFCGLLWEKRRLGLENDKFDFWELSIKKKRKRKRKVSKSHDFKS